MSSKETIKTIKCPFNPAHVMPYERFLNHLEKCQFPDKKSYRKCKFNPYHVYHMEMINNHQSKCPDKKKYEEDDDDWGVEDVPEKKQIEYIKQPSHVSYSTSFSEANSSKYSSSDASYEQGFKNADKKYQNNKDKKIEKKSIDNSLMQVQDLDDFNPQN